MGTRSLIAKQIGPDTYRTIFCKIEGHLESQGEMLLQYYNTPEQVDKLLDLGDLYTLCPKLEPDPSKHHSYEKPQADVTVAYQRDWQCTNVEAEINTFEELDESGGMIEFIYIFDQNNEWKYFQGGYSEEGLRDVRADLQALEQGIDILKGPPFDFLDELLDDSPYEEISGL
ncbi:MAG: hypothetical protein IJ001_11745 [Oscillospiraceae bacterium]|nr:hypothetical protein [Oscillospiraceae bacterium]